MKTILRVLLFSALASAAAIQTVAAASGDWPQLGFNAHGRRENPYETVLSRKTVPHLALKWSADLGAVSSPVVANGLVYAGSFDGHLYARDAETGATVWSAATGSGIESSPAVADGAVYVGSDDGRLYSFDAETGALRWSVSGVTNPYSSPTVAGDTVFVAGDRTVFALNTTNGGTRWSVANPVGVGPGPAPAVADGIVYVAWAGELVAYDKRNGTALWTANANASRFVGEPAVDKGNVYLFTDEYLYDFDAKTGNTIWSITGSGEDASIAVSGGHLFLGSMIHVLFSYDRHNGQIAYARFPTPPIASAPAIANGVLYAGSAANTIDAYDTENSTVSLLWTAPTARAVEAAPIVSNGMLYVTDGSTLYAYGLDRNR